jgi:hypothetical protein
MHKSATKCNETQGKLCKNKHGASKIIDTFETYHWGDALGDGDALGRGDIVGGGDALGGGEPGREGHTGGEDGPAGPAVEREAVAVGSTGAAGGMSAEAEPCRRPCMVG